MNFSIAFPWLRNSGRVGYPCFALCFSTVHEHCRTDSRESWNRMVFAVFAFTICATPVPVYCSRTTCRWKKFRNGSDTATSLLRQIFTRILTINQKYLRQKQCWQDWAWVDVQHSSIPNNEKSLTKPSFARLPSMAETVGFEPTSPIKRANRFRVCPVMTASIRLRKIPSSLTPWKKER